MAPPSLLGPPEIYTAITTTTTTTTKYATTDKRKRRVSRSIIIKRPSMGYTENGSATFLSSGNPCLDFFFHVVPDTPPEEVVNRVQWAWNHDPLMTLKLICNLRGVRGTGKSDKERFYTAALWLHENHPKTLARNVEAIADFGYFKDMLEILYRLLEGSDSRKEEKENWKMNKYEVLHSKRKGKYMKLKGKARADKLGKNIAKAKKAIQRYISDHNYQFLHDCVSEFFATLLKKDMEFYHAGELHKISLASKWCPSLDSSYDRATLMCESVARKMFPPDDYIEYQDMADAHYAYRVRDRLRKEVLVPLHKALELPEIYICANKWNELPYKRVASVAMTHYKRLFCTHDGERFAKYLEDVKSGKTTIAAGALLPHEIIGALNNPQGVNVADVAELQWKRMVDDLSKKGQLKNCMAICDVSGSMYGTPMEVCVALGLLISELSEEPWKGSLITFSKDPQLHEIKGETLREKTEFIQRMDWGMNTDFQKVFDRILKVAVEGKLREDEMIKRLFVFSDMEFDQACTNNWETDYQVILRKFQEKGYRKVPEIVFWNLRNSQATPVPSNQKGVALVSGFSKNLVTLFLEEGGIIDPEAAMLQAISGKEYQRLVVFD